MREWQCRAIFENPLQSLIRSSRIIHFLDSLILVKEDTREHEKEIERAEERMLRTTCVKWSRMWTPLGFTLTREQLSHWSRAVILDPLHVTSYCSLKSNIEFGYISASKEKRKEKWPYSQHQLRHNIFPGAGMEVCKSIIATRLNYDCAGWTVCPVTGG